MSIITAFEFDGQVIRSTDDGRFSLSSKKPHTYRDSGSVEMNCA